MTAPQSPQPTVDASDAVGERDELARAIDPDDGGGGVSVVLEVTVTRPPAKPTFVNEGQRQVVSVTGIYSYRDGGWSGKPRFKGLVRRVLKDGSLGAVQMRAPWNWEPDQETREQFARAAESLVRQAANYA